MILRMNHERKSSATAKKSIKNIPYPCLSECMKWNLFDLSIELIGISSSLTTLSFHEYHARLGQLVLN